MSLHPLFGEILAQHGLAPRPRYRISGGAYEPGVIESPTWPGHFIGYVGFDAVTDYFQTRGAAEVALSAWCDTHRHLAEA